MIRVLFINPSMPYEVKGHLQTPLGICYLSSSIADIAITKVIDSNICDNLEKDIIAFNPNVVGISVLTATVKKSLDIVKLVRKVLNYRCVLIAGGIHASTFPADMLKNGFDYVIRGEGERIIHNLIECIGSNKDIFFIRGISYINNMGQVVSNPDEKTIDDLDSIPFPDRKDLELGMYEHESIITSRGCGFKCFYCSSSHYWGKQVRFRSVENVFEELLQLYNNGIRKFYFCDDNFTLSEKRVVDLCNRIIGSSLNIKWSCLTRVDTINYELLLKMKEAGCTTLSLGIESGLEEVYAKIKKTSLNTMKKAFAMIRDVGITTRTTWIVGLGKTVDEEYQSLRLIKEILPDQVSVHCLIPYPNTDAWMYPEKYNLEFDKESIDWDIMNMTYSPYLLDYIHFKHISKEQVIEMITSIKHELDAFGYDGRTRKFESFLDHSIVKVIQ